MNRIAGMSLLLIILFSLNIYSEQDSYKQGMKEGFDTYSNGETYSDWVKGAEILSATGKKHPNEWLPEYWASYFYTQIARVFNSIKNPPENQSMNGLLNLSQKNLDIAISKLDNLTPSQKSDIAVLQALIYDFRAIAAADKTVQKNFEEKSNLQIKLAVKENSDNPLMEVYIGTSLMFKKDLSSTLAARSLFLKAKQVFDARIQPRYLSTHWAEQWIQYWIPQSEKGLAKLSQ